MNYLANVLMKLLDKLQLIVWKEVKHFFTSNIGIILARVRDDLFKTIQSYKGLYNGSIPFGEQK